MLPSLVEHEAWVFLETLKVLGTLSAFCIKLYGFFYSSGEFPKRITKFFMHVHLFYRGKPLTCIGTVEICIDYMRKYLR